MDLLALVLAAAVAQAQAAPSHAAQPSAREIAPDTYLLPGSMYSDRGPDGNTVIVVAPAGLVVVDTGRHPWHSDGILAFARGRRLPVSAIVNTHWHLDHSSGNRRVKAAYPQARVYTTRAVDRALAPGGFLARALATQREHPADPKAPAVRQEERDLFVGTMEAADALRPDVPVEHSSPLTIAGRPFAAHVTANAVTDADLWLFDEATGVAVIGDLVTLPAPFFETACPGPWQDALDNVWATPFRVAIPGHGTPMTRTEFDIYRKAFGAFRACVGSDSPPAACAAAWTRDVRPLLATDAERRQAADYAAYYVEFLRRTGGVSPDCRAK
jgi:glyoxylase-like metal-dependent hydrolase (beta-lactamase superfamily II)